MRIGFDVDGVLAHFEAGYERLIVRTSGRNLFPWEPGTNRPRGSPVWDWLQHFGYTAQEVGAVWDVIKTDGKFWLELDPTPDVADLRAAWPSICDYSDIYFVTSRPGVRAKWQTERWLAEHCGADRATVIIASDKGGVARALNLDAYIDDNIDNAVSVTRDSPTTRTYLLDAAYNACNHTNGFTRVVSLGQMIKSEWP